LGRALRSCLLQRAQAELHLPRKPHRELEKIPPRSGTRRSDAASAPASPQRQGPPRRRPA
jgi:hypothetical protein